MLVCFVLFADVHCYYCVVNPYLVLGCISNQPLSVSEADVGWGGSVPLVVRNDLHLSERL